VDTAVVTFEPLPREYLARGRAPARLQSFREKYAALAQLGVDRLLCLRFNERCGSMSAEILRAGCSWTGCGRKVVVLGDDFRFGRQREGDSRLHARTGSARASVTLPTTTVELDGERISSTRCARRWRRGFHRSPGVCWGATIPCRDA
jgi:riboflavin kinase/FMN adenylyltransferase